MTPTRAAALALGACVVGGLLSSRLPTQAWADDGAIFVPVPTRGIVFRAEGGRAIARVRSDVAGGVIEVLDAHERVAIRLRATVNGGTIEVGRTSTLAGPSLTVGSYEDPGY